MDSANEVAIRTPVPYKMYEVAIYTLPHLKWFRLGSVLSSHLPFKMH